MNEDYERGWTFTGVALLGVGLALFQAQSNPWSLAASVFAAGVVVADAIWGRFHPLVSITPHSLVVDRAMLARRRELEFAEIAGWAVSPHFLRFQLLDGSKLDILLTMFAERRRAELIARLRTLELGVPGATELSDESLRRYERRLFGFSFGGTFAVMLVAVALTFYLLR